jgi:hypothetical protein
VPEGLPRLIRANTNSVVAGALVIAMLASAIVLLHAGRGQTMREDGLGYAARLASEPLGHALLHAPPNKYLIAVPLLLYDGMFNAFGLGADLPYRLVVTAFVLLSAGLFFVLARRRVGNLMALAPTCLLLFFGSSWEPLITYVRMPSLLAVTTGLGALLALERRDRRGEIAAAVLLSASVASHPVGLAFLTAAGVIVILGGPTRGWSRIWLVGPAVAIFGGWWLFLRETTPSAAPTTAGDVVTFVAQSWTTIVADITGLAGVVGDPSFHQVPAKILAAALLGLATAVVLPRLPRVPPTLWGALAGLVVLFASTRLAPQGFERHPDDVRYLYPAAVFFLWLLIEVLGLINPRALLVGAVIGVLGLGLAYNLAQLSDGSKLARFGSAAARGQYAAYELAGDRVDPSYRVAPIGYPSAGDYLRAAAAYGSAAEPLGELPTASVATRQAADRALAGSLDIALQTVPWDPGRAGTPPNVKVMISGRSRRIRNCLRLLPGQSGPGLQSVPVNPRPSYREALIRALTHQPVPTVPELAQLGPFRGGLFIRARRMGGVAALVGMFLSPPSAQLDQLPRGNTALLRLPAVAVPRPWDVTLAANQPITVCPIG